MLFKFQTAVHVYDVALLILFSLKSSPDVTPIEFDTSVLNQKIQQTNTEYLQSKLEM